jgi:hypothetical protein
LVLNLLTDRAAKASVAAVLLRSQTAMRTDHRPPLAA